MNPWDLVVAITKYINDPNTPPIQRHILAEMRESILLGNEVLDHHVAVVEHIGLAKGGASGANN